MASKLVKTATVSPRPASKLLTSNSDGSQVWQDFIWDPASERWSPRTRTTPAPVRPPPLPARPPPLIPVPPPAALTPLPATTVTIRDLTPGEFAAAQARGVAYTDWLRSTGQTHSVASALAFDQLYP